MKRVLTEEHKKKIGLANKNKPSKRKGTTLSAATKEKMSIAQKGKIISEETKIKLSQINLGRVRTKEEREKISKGMMGRIVSAETREKISKAQKGKQRKPFTIEQRTKLSVAGKGRVFTEETKAKISKGNKGKKRSDKTKAYLSSIRQGKNKGVDNPNWKGGLTSGSLMVRNSDKNIMWRQSCMIRDNFTCQECGDNMGGNLEVHHIKPFKELIQEVKIYLPLFSLYDGAMAYGPLWDLDNGITLCKNCHNKYRKNHY